MIIIILCICYQGSIYWRVGIASPKKSSDSPTPSPKTSDNYSTTPK